ARDQLVRRHLWTRPAPSTIQSMFYAIAPKSIQGMVHTRAIRAVPSHVHAVGVGGKNDGEESAVIVYVTRKLPEEAIPPDEMVPASVNGIPTDVVESPIPRLAACTDHRRKKTRPLVGGISVGR